MYTKQGEVGRSRRRHGAEFRAKVLAECRQPGVSISAVALRNGLNANMVRRWLKLDGIDPEPTASEVSEPAFIAVPMVPEVAAASASSKRNIHVEVQRGSTTVSVSWPADAAAECGAWLREWLR